jgi:hypothetical protein
MKRDVVVLSRMPADLRRVPMIVVTATMHFAPPSVVGTAMAKRLTTPETGSIGCAWRATFPSWMEDSMVLSGTTRSTPAVAASRHDAHVFANPEFLNTEEAAVFLRLSPRTLEKRRVIGGGPRFRKFGTRVLYAVVDLRAWADRRAYTMTSDPSSVQRRSAR